MQRNCNSSGSEPGKVARLSLRLRQIAVAAQDHAQHLGDGAIGDPDANPYPFVSGVDQLRTHHREAAQKLHLLSSEVARQGLTPRRAREASALLSELAAHHREESNLVWRMYSEDLGVCD
jgi:hypothetical protein